MSRPKPMTYQQAAEWLEQLADPERTGLTAEFGRQMSLDATLRLMELLGNPHEGLCAVHIGGTKGKGSVSAMVEAAARASGMRTGLFTSPHLVSWRERIRLDGVPISEDEVARLAMEVRPAVEQVERENLRGPSFFEACTAMALLCFAERDLDIAILEVGLGGRLDATNVITPRVSAITTLGLDHTNILGDTLEQIAAEKAAIIKPGVPVICAPGKPGPSGVIAQTAHERAAPLRVVDPFELGEVHPLSPDEIDDEALPILAEPLSGRFAGEQVVIDLPLLGVHQAINAAVAAGICEELARQGLPITRDAFVEGLTAVRWPARVQLAGARPWIIVDCGHNEASMRALMRAMRRHLVFDRLYAVLGVSHDKPAEGVARELSSVDHAILTQASISRAMPADDLAEATRFWWRSYEVVADPAEALERAKQLAAPRDAICVTGSFFVIADLMETGALPRDL